jgi:hypothetical protein
VYVNPTLVLTWGASTTRWRDWTAAAAEMIKDPGLGFVPAEVRELWTRPPGRTREGYSNAAEFLRRYSEAGGKVLAATDTGCCNEIIPGLSLHYEMQMLTDLGIPPMKAIQGRPMGQSNPTSVQSGAADSTVIPRLQAGSGDPG